jgi:hypothetical protein
MAASRCVSSMGGVLHAYNLLTALQSAVAHWMPLDATGNHAVNDDAREPWFLYPQAMPIDRSLLKSPSQRYHPNHPSITALSSLYWLGTLSLATHHSPLAVHREAP